MNSIVKKLPHVHSKNMFGYFLKDSFRTTPYCTRAGAYVLQQNHAVLQLVKKY